MDRILWSVGRRYKRLNSRPLLYLFLHVLISGLALLLGSGISPLLGFLYYDNSINNPWIIGLPIPIIDSIWPFFNMSWQIGALSLIFLLAFCKSIFFKPNNVVFRSYIIIVLLFIVFTSLYGIFIYGLEKNFPADESSVSLYGNILYLFISGGALWGNSWF